MLESSSSEMSVCDICLQSEAKYSCPRCNLSYCGLQCYKCPAHNQCSESFYKECVTEELKLVSSDSKAFDAKQKTIGALKKIASDQDKCDDEILDSDDDDDLSERLAGVDLDDADQLWASLTPEERRDFNEKVKSGQVFKLVPHEERENTQLWWEVHHPVIKITDLDAPKEYLHPQIPIIYIDGLGKIDTSKGSPIINYNIINVLYAYVSAYRHLSYHKTSQKKQVNDFTSLVLNLSATFSSNENFSSAELAIQSASSAQLNQPDMTQTSADMARADVAEMVKGPGGSHDDLLYVLAALIDLKTIIGQCKKNQSRNRKQLGVIVKKLDFYIDWIRQQPTAFLF